ncbi:ribosome maturation factor RimM [Arcanobacterium hippocoleae]|uniref:Ribosome maturation factor RimM n=1 Tax=Arcanobacterium hippocoleae TaxID=149017 RepID=A0ABU1T162_9ACTO|nr:ribosome maturation factor RimM [Arcanobacterium hippocoleae]MDR6939100.1 16S rRNA processing protein RimM [Arcanobacterium hippocoleae]
MQLTVAIIGAAHGLKGEVKLDLRTDVPEQRIQTGLAYETDPADFGPLEIVNVRKYKESVFVKFAQITDRSAAESLRGVKLVIESDEIEAEADAWYPHELIGLEALDPEGYELGIVTGLQPMPMQDLLIVTEQDGRMVQVPFVKEIVTEVDIDDHCVVIDAPPGLFSEDELEIVISDGGAAE